MLKGTVSSLRLGIALLGAVSLAGAPLPLRAAGILSTSLVPIDGVVVSATDTTLVIHPPIGSDVTLNLTDATRIRPDGQHPSGTPSPGSIVGQYARAHYDPNSLTAAHIILRPPVPLPAVGLVHASSTTGFSLTLRDGRILSLEVDARTALRLNGRPGTSSQLGTGDRVEALFLLESSANRALRVNAHRLKGAAPERAGVQKQDQGKGAGTTPPSGNAGQNLPVPPTTPNSATVPITTPKPETLPGKPQGVPGKPQTLPGKLETIPGKPANLPGKPQPLPGKPQPLPGKPDTLPGKPQNLTGKPEMLPGKPQSLPGKPQNLTGKPESLPGKPANLPGKPGTIAGKPATLPGQPQSLPGKPTNLPGKPQPLPGKPDSLPGKP